MHQSAQTVSQSALGSKGQLTCCADWRLLKSSERGIEVINQVSWHASQYRSVGLLPGSVLVNRFFSREAVCRRSI